jgi:L-asparagine transporter-like permease
MGERKLMLIAVSAGLGVGITLDAVKYIAGPGAAVCLALAIVGTCAVWLWRAP